MTHKRHFTIGQWVRHRIDHEKNWGPGIVKDISAICANCILVMWENQDYLSTWEYPEDLMHTGEPEVCRLTKITQDLEARIEELETAARKADEEIQNLINTLKEPEEPEDDILDMPIEDFYCKYSSGPNIPCSTILRMKKDNVYSVRDLIKKSNYELMDIRGFGPIRCQRMVDALTNVGLKLSPQSKMTSKKKDTNGKTST